MFERVGNGFSLIKQSLRVLRLDKELLVFPLFSLIALIGVVASFVTPLWQIGYFETLDESGSPEASFYLLLFLFYVASYFVMIFFNAAIVECAIIRFRGDDPTVADGLKGAASRLPQIFGWAVVAATVGLILRAIEERSGLIGRFIVGLMGLAWSAATFFVVPVIVMERLGPIDAAKRSTDIVKKTWAEALGAHMGIGLAASLLYFVTLSVAGYGGYLMFSGSAESLGLLLLAVGVGSFFLVALCVAVVQAVVTAALYMYAGQGVVPDQFEQNTLDRVFTRKSA